MDRQQQVCIRDAVYCTFPFPAYALQWQSQPELYKRFKFLLPERNKPPPSCEKQTKVACKWLYSKPSQIIAKKHPTIN